MTDVPGKQIIYVDVDDEITTIIDKMNASDARVVAFVLPKRATVFQSVVNMKLLKRRAENAKKNIVLVTSEASLMPLAGLAGIHVAPTPQSKPEIPAGSLDQTDDDDEEEATSLDSDDFNPDQNGTTPVGQLAANGKPGLNGQDDDVIELDNSSKSTLKKSAPSPIVGKDSKMPKIPNFFRFRKRLLLGGLVLILLIVGWYMAYFVLPKATVTIKTNSSDIDTQLALTLDTAASQVNADKLIIPAQNKQEQKANTQSVPTTGQENKGDKSAGTVTMTADVCGTPSTPPDVPAGTGVTTGGLTYITQKAASFNYAGIGGGCIHFTANAVAIGAEKGGANYNVDSATFSVAGRSDAKATGTTTGGTDNNVKVVQQADIDAAKQKMTTAQDQDGVKKQLQSTLEDNGLYALPATFFAGEANVNPSAAVGDEADTVTVTQSITYTMFGVKKDDLTKLIEDTASKKIDTKKQGILDNGLSKARITLQTPGAGPQLPINVGVVVTAGPKINAQDLAKSLTGLKTGEVRDRIRSTPGVNDVEVKYSPFWVVKAPKAQRITIQFEKSSDAK